MNLGLNPLSQNKLVANIIRVTFITLKIIGNVRLCTLKVFSENFAIFDVPSFLIICMTNAHAVMASST